MSSSSTEFNEMPRGFETTQWYLVADAAHSREAFQELCSRYWRPVYAHLRRMGRNPHEAEELAQAFFLRLTEKSILAFADQNRGRFRTFLLTALHRFCVNEWKYQTRLRRGGEHRMLPLIGQTDEGSDDWISSRELTPDRQFDRDWAIQLIRTAFRVLAEEQEQQGNPSRFQSLAPLIACEPDAPKYETLASELQTSAPVLRMTVSRLRQRLGEIVRDEIRKTIDDGASVEDELLELFRALNVNGLRR